jgi:hypothetical protein
MHSTLCKFLLIIPLILFIDWIIMVTIGCFASVCNANEKFFCSIYCISGIILLSLSIIMSLYIVFRKKSTIVD